MDKLKNGWSALENREQLVIGIGGVTVMLCLLVFFAILPMLDWQQRAWQHLQQARDEANQVRQLADRINASKRKSVGSVQGADAGLAALIDSTLQENQLVMRGFQPGSNNDVRLRLENAAYSSLVQWLYDLEYRYKVTVMDLSLTPSGTSGRLTVGLRVSKP